MKNSALYFFVFLCYCTSMGQKNFFLQNKVDNVYSKELEKLKKENLVQKNNNCFMQKKFVKQLNKTKGENDIQKLLNESDKGVMYITNDSLIINNDTSISNNIYVLNNGVLIIDSAFLTLSGHLIAIDNGKIIIRNNAHLKFNQFFINQYIIWLQDSASFIASNATIDGNQISMNDINLYDNSIYIAKNVNFLDWSFRKIHDKSTVILEDIDYVGDMLVRDSCQVNIKRCNLMIPWLQIPDNSVINISFPQYNINTDTVFHFEFNEAVPNVDGIGYSISIDTCTEVMWAVDAEKGCNLSIFYSVIYGYMHDFADSDTLIFSGLYDSTFYTNLSVPFNDRNCHLFNSFVYSWQLYGNEDSAVLYIDSCSFGELMAKENCEIYATNSICDGIWLHLGVTNNGFISFSDGLVKSFADTWNNATLLLTNSEIRAISQWSPPPLGPNYAHSHSNFLSVNSEYDYLPQALDTSLVMFVYVNKLDTVNTDTITNIPIYGSAWLQTGTYNTTTFAQYKLYYQSVDSSAWTLINGATDTVHSDILGYWNTGGLPAGDYIIRLTIWDNNNDSLSALRKVTLANTTSINEQKLYKEYNCFIYPNPANDIINIDMTLYKKNNIKIFIFDIAGKKIGDITDSYFEKGKYLFSYSSRNFSSGIYYVKMITSKTSKSIKVEIIK